MLTLTGKCTSSMSALVFLEGLIDILPDSIKTETFLDEYESALNRVRHEMSKIWALNLKHSGQNILIWVPFIHVAIAVLPCP